MPYPYSHPECDAIPDTDPHPHGLAHAYAQRYAHPLTDAQRNTIADALTESLPDAHCDPHDLRLTVIGSDSDTPLLVIVVPVCSDLDCR